MNGISNGGIMVTNEEGNLPGFLPVYYNPNSLMNIIAMSNMRKKFIATMDTSQKVAIMVHLGNGRIL